MRCELSNEIQRKYKKYIAPDLSDDRSRRALLTECSKTLSGLQDIQFVSPPSSACFAA
jgi:hypothetical protein